MTDDCGVVCLLDLGCEESGSGEAALPRLQDLNCKLEAAKATMHKLGDPGKAAIKSLVRLSQAKLKAERPG